MNEKARMTGVTCENGNIIDESKLGIEVIGNIHEERKTKITNKNFIRK